MKVITKSQSNAFKLELKREGFVIVYPKKDSYLKEVSIDDYIAGIYNLRGRGERKFKGLVKLLGPSLSTHPGKFFASISPDEEYRRKSSPRPLIYLPDEDIIFLYKKSSS
jgi:hypothetical protein